MPENEHCVSMRLINRVIWKMGGRLMADAFFILDIFLNICTPVFEKHSREKVNVQGLKEGG